MKNLFAVIMAKGQAWDANKHRRSQKEWDQHAVFMDKLATDGFVVLGGPLGPGDGDDVLLVIDAADEDEIISTLKDDPWSASKILKVKEIQRWTILLESGVK